jgi:archaeosine-15-forming tRNA-guanine transglycosylase
MSDDQPTTAAEMALMEELRRLIEAADEQIDQETAEQLEADILGALLKVRSVVDRAEAIATLRRSKGLPSVSRENGELLGALYERAQHLRDQLEEL